MEEGKARKKEDLGDPLQMTSLLELGCLALLHCPGTQLEKANFLFELAQPDLEALEHRDQISWQDKELDFIVQ